ncbi:MAG: hypothetical protein KDB79_07530 [Acidobacteria bacterium]|nr:hypothetical protein [Acidobacteriota bacterium]
MSAKDTKGPDYSSLGSPGKKGAVADREPKNLSSPNVNRKSSGEKVLDDSSLKPPGKFNQIKPLQQATDPSGREIGAEVSNLDPKPKNEATDGSPRARAEAEIGNEKRADDSVSDSQKAILAKREKKIEQDKKLLSGDNWLIRNGHGITYAGLFAFSVLVLFRPYELIPQLSFLSSSAFYIAAATLAIYIPTQLSTEGNLTMMSTEVKCILGLTLLGLLTISFASDPSLAFETFNDIFIKAVLIFIVMANAVRTRKRLMGLILLSLSIAVYLSYSAWTKYMTGVFAVEGYRVEVDIGGMFENPNDMALHLVMMLPIAIALGIASKNYFIRAAYLTIGALITAAIFVTYSRGGFLGLLAMSAVLVWKLSRGYRLNAMIISAFVGGLTILLAPGNYGLRILSIFVPSLDPVGSRGQRSELLWQSILVSGRHPWGIGMGNFNEISIGHLGTHNAYTQVAAELGTLGLLAYLIFLLSPLRKLAAIERAAITNENAEWYYYLSIGMQASIVGYMVSSFFGAVAYNWYIYYAIAYAVAFRRIYVVEKGKIQ